MATQKSRKNVNFRKGAALLVVLVTTAILLAAIGSFYAYVSFSSRMMSVYMGNDVCRLVAQSEMEIAKSIVTTEFAKFLAEPRRIVVAGSDSDPFRWFGAYNESGADTEARQWIGEDVHRITFDPETIVYDDPNNTSGYFTVVRVGVVKIKRSETEGLSGVTTSVDITLVSRAERKNPGGTTSQIALTETLRFQRERSRVFENAYFVNNYGWFSGERIVANGDVRANGDFYLDKSITINGHVYAARNEELGVNGNINEIGEMITSSKYISQNYGSGARPLKNDPKTGAINIGGYDAPDEVLTATKQSRIHANGEVSVEMPFIGDISASDSEYRRWAEELHSADSNMSTIKQGSKTLVTVYHNGVGPSGVATVIDETTPDRRNVQAPDYGAIVLDGRVTPIEVNGPVIIPSDVIILGKVKGQGTIYSGRNIHIVGNIEYVNPPTWAGKSTSGTNNSSKDMLGLMAKGNIVLGDSTKSTWTNDIKEYLTSNTYVKKYACDPSDAVIGYPSTFGGSYINKEYVNAATFNESKAAGFATMVPGGYQESSGNFGRWGKVKTNVQEEYQERVRNKQTGKYEYVTKTRTVEKEIEGLSYDRKYYDTVCKTSEISSRASDITRIDAIMYNNHGIMGYLGNGASSLYVNGALICRNEAISLKLGKSGSANLAVFNWDARLAPHSSEGVSNNRVGLAKANDSPPLILSWMEIPANLYTFPEI